MKKFKSMQTLVFTSMQTLILTVLLQLLLISPSVRAQSDDDIKNLKGKIDGDVYLPDSPDFTKNSATLFPNFNKKPKLVVAVNSVEDVSQALIFADKFDLSTRVMSSGHDYNGRNTGNDILQLNLKRLNKIVVNDGNQTAWVDTACEWGKVYQEVDKYQKLAVGGSTLTVCPGGCIAGGCHSPMSPSLGLGVDSVVAIEMVAMDGRIMKVYENKILIKSENGTWEEEADSDLFWALRGGGGGTFGIVTRYEIKLHEPPPEGFVHLVLIYPIKHEQHGNFGERLLEFYSKEMNKLNKAKWGGYVIINTKVIQDKPRVTGTITFFMLRPGGYEEAFESIKDLYNFEPNWQIHKELKKVPTFWEYSKNISDPTGFRVAVANTLFQKDDFDRPENWKKVLNNMLEFEMEMTCTGANLGGQVNVPSDDSASINPDFRSAWMSFSCGAGWAEARHDKDVFGIVHEFGNQMTCLMGKGVYLNEPDYHLNNWKEQFWGDMARYNKLLKIKEKWDPKSLLKCRHCVGDVDDGNADAKDDACNAASHHVAPVFVNLFLQLGVILGALMILIV